MNTLWKMFNLQQLDFRKSQSILPKSGLMLNRESQSLDLQEGWLTE
jgi:hypothetical protein